MNWRKYTGTEIGNRRRSRNYVFQLDTMKFNLLDDGKLCYSTESDEGEETEDSEEDIPDFTVKAYFDKIIVTE